MKIALIIFSLLLAASCSERAVESKPIDHCEDAQAFRNWVAKNHPNVWHECYATHCGGDL